MLPHVIRRLVAVLALVATSNSATESVLGALRDGAVHHESGAAAAIHRAARADGRHGHEDLAPRPDHQQTHQHGTAADHCTHQHGTAMIVTIASASGSAPTLGSPQASALSVVTLIAFEVFNPPKA